LARLTKEFIVSEIKLFRLNGGKAAEIPGTSGGLEKSLQTLIENNLEPTLGIRFLATEYSTGKTHGGRVDTLGIDENCCPVIIEYKRAVSENVVSQGLFYLDWLLDHKAEFKLLVMEQMDKKTADEIDWSDPRLICVAADFTRYDEHAVRQMDRNIDLVRYRKFGGDLLALELVHRTSTQTQDKGSIESTALPAKANGDKPVHQAIADAEPHIRDLYESLRSYILALGDDVQESPKKLYMVYRRLKNFACVVIQKKALVVFTKLDPATVNLAGDDILRDVSEIGHWGTGDLEITIHSAKDLERAQALVLQSYQEA
jgi:predicted transport protein